MFQEIIEQKDADDKQQSINEINSGMYIYNSEALAASLELLSNENSQGEYYLTDTIALIKKIGLKVSARVIDEDKVDEIKGVNTIEQLKEAEEIMEKRGF